MHSALHTFLYAPFRTERQTRSTSLATVFLVGRVLLATIFVLSGISKLGSFGPTAEMMRGEGIPLAPLMLLVAAAVEIIAGLMLMTGTFTRLASLALMAFLIPTTLIFHDFWLLEGSERQMQLANFLKNTSIFGGLMLLFAEGPALYSVDARLEHRLRDSSGKP